MTALDVNIVGRMIEKIDVPKNLTVLTGDNQPDDNQGCFRLLTETAGDERIVWNRLNLAEVADATKMFNDLVKKGLVPYEVGTNGKATSEVMKKFDPMAEEVIFIPIQALAGG